MGSSGVRRLAMSRMVASKRKPVKAAAGLFARILGMGGRKILRYPKTVKIDMMSTQKAKEALREKFNKTKGKGMTLKEADTTKFNID